MYEHKMEKEIRCSLEYGMELFGGKWKSRIICLLSQKKVMRYNELKKDLLNITDTVLASTLKEMASDGMILRVQYNEIPPKVEYSLSEMGKSVIPVLRNICVWAGIYQKQSDNLSVCSKCDYNAKSFI